ncbi:hypothetical protein ACI2K4_04710 [Micromonospora sp. NPDC050397]|uniref:hypothetical protein n=1 Tax=Micromonospora sp. NPDC050397 TaxID=3364279 RepID=UPI00384BA7AB
MTAARTNIHGHRAPRRIATLLATLLLASTGLVGTTAGPASASWYGATVGSWTPNPGVALRDCYHPTVQLPPGTYCTEIRRIPKNTGVHIVCQRSGQNIDGNNVWDYVVYSGGEGFVADYYMNTGHANWIPGVDICS